MWELEFHGSMSFNSIGIIGLPIWGWEFGVVFSWSFSRFLGGGARGGNPRAECNLFIREGFRHGWDTEFSMEAVKQMTPQESQRISLNIYSLRITSISVLASGQYVAGLSGHDNMRYDQKKIKLQYAYKTHWRWVFTGWERGPAGRGLIWQYDI